MQISDRIEIWIDPSSFEAFDAIDEISRHFHIDPNEFLYWRMQRGIMRFRDPVRHTIREEINEGLGNWN